VLIADNTTKGAWIGILRSRSYDPTADKPGAEIPTPAWAEEPLTFIPNPVEFPGMPNIRWWEFEDRKTDFGSIQPSTTDLATLILAEFGLVYGNDWSLVPYRMRVGVLSEIIGIVVTDVFGVRTLVRSAVNSLDGEGDQWGMYYLKDRQGEGVDPRLFLPPVLGKNQESTPLEQVILARDEMANMVGGSAGDSGPAGGGIDGYEAAAAWMGFPAQGRRRSWNELTQELPFNTAWARGSRIGSPLSRCTSRDRTATSVCSAPPCRAYLSTRRCRWNRVGRSCDRG
jgi:hypothetical protein